MFFKRNKKYIYIFCFANKLYTHKYLQLGSLITVNLLHESPKSLAFCNMRSRSRKRIDTCNFSVAQFFLKLVTGLATWGRRRRLEKLEWLGQTKEIKGGAVEQLYMDNISMGPTIHRYWIHWSLCQHPCYCCQVSEILQNGSFLLPRYFCPPYMIAMASLVHVFFSPGNSRENRFG